ncbi:MAG: TIGR01212 family radical SAM protein [Muribaculaceae bacterium]|nr:TIGR01212 family radical SAM protein [Muribaculaceae bacterium]
MIVAEFYRDFSDFLSERFPGKKMQKITINAGFTCPNRDGTKGRGGCSYCNNQSFNPAFASSSKSVTQQIEDGIRFFSRKYPQMRYLAYFQAYTNTHGSFEKIRSIYEEALAHPLVDGIIIGTRPDCMPDELLDYLSELNRQHFVLVEYGAESSHDSTLDLVNRCHHWSDTVDAVNRTAQVNIHVGLHFILGLPGETDEMILQTLKRAALLPIEIIKLHQLQIIKGTRMAKDYEEHLYPIRQFTVEEYIELCCKIIDIVPKRISIERFVSQSPDDLLISPRWGLKNYQFSALLNRRLCEIHQDLRQK